jgi:hypothetical protein
MPGGEARAARGSEPAGAPTPRGGGCSPASNRSARQWSGARDPCPAWQGQCALWYAYAYHGRDGRLGTPVALQAAGLHVAVLRG